MPSMNALNTLATIVSLIACKTRKTTTNQLPNLLCNAYQEPIRSAFVAVQSGLSSPKIIQQKPKLVLTSIVNL